MIHLLTLHRVKKILMFQNQRSRRRITKKTKKRKRSIRKTSKGHTSQNIWMIKAFIPIKEDLMKRQNISTHPKKWKSMDLKMLSTRSNMADKNMKTRMYLYITWRSFSQIKDKLKFQKCNFWLLMKVSQHQTFTIPVKSISKQLISESHSIQ